MFCCPYYFTLFLLCSACFFLFLLCCQKGDFSGKINDKGCLPAGEKWLEQNLISIAGVAVGIAFLQILGICFAQNLRADIFAQMAKWN